MKLHEKIPGWFYHPKYGRVYCYDAETSDKPEAGRSCGFIHFGTSEKGADRLGWCGIFWFDDHFKESSMRNDTKLKQQALMLKAAFEEGWSFASNSSDPQIPLDEQEEYNWQNSTAKQMHDQLLAEAKGNLNVKANVGNG